MAQRTALEDRLAEAMYARSVQGLSREDAPAWLALASSDRDGWIELARFAVDAANALRDEDTADDALDMEGSLREELDARYRREVDHWRAAVERLEADLARAIGHVPGVSVKPTEPPS